MFWGSKGRLPISSFLGGNAVAFAMFLLIEPPLREAYSSVKTRPPPASTDNHWIVFHLSVVRECYLRSSWCWWSFLCGDFKKQDLKKERFGFLTSCQIQHGTLHSDLEFLSPPSSCWSCYNAQQGACPLFPSPHPHPVSLPYLRITVLY